MGFSGQGLGTHGSLSALKGGFIADYTGEDYRAD